MYTHFFLKKSVQYVRALYDSNSFHFNLLVDSNNIPARKAAAAQEEQFFSELKKDLDSTQPMDFFDLGPSSSSSSSFTSIHQRPFSQIGTEQTFPTPRIQNFSLQQQDQLPVEEPQYFSRITADRMPVDLTFKKVSDFINRVNNIINFEGFFPGASLNVAFTFLKKGLESEQLPEEERILYQFGIVRLFLDFAPPTNTFQKEIYGTHLISKMEEIINSYAQSKEAKLKRFANYARIYLGKLFIALDCFDEAYEAFSQVGNKYTKTYLVDIAEMIIDHGYRPSDLGEDQDPNEYVIKLLSNPISSTSKSGSSKRTRATGGEFGANSESIGRPQFLTSKSVQRRKDDLCAEAFQRIEGTHRTTHPTRTTTTHFSELTQSAQSRSSSPTGDWRDLSTRRRKRTAPVEADDADRLDDDLRELKRSRFSTTTTHPSTSVQSIQSLGTSSRREGGELSTQEEEEFNVTGDYELTDDYEFRNDYDGYESSQTSSPEDFLPLEDRDQETDDFLSQTFREEFRRLLYLGKAHRNEEAVRYFLLAKECARKIGDQQALAKTEIGLGNARDGDRIGHYQAALGIAQEIGDRSLEAQALIGLGNSSRNQEALDYYREAFKIAPSEKLREQASNGIRRVEKIINFSSRHRRGS